MKKNKYTYRILIVSVAVLLVVSLGITYSYLSPLIGGTGNNTINVSSSTFDVNFTSSKYINKVFLPISDTDYLTKGDHTDFTISLVNNAAAKYDIKLDMKVTSNQLSNVSNLNFLKYKLVSGETTIAEGNFSTGTTTTSFTSSDTIEYTLASNITQNDASKSYVLYVWCSDTDSDQSYLLNSSFEMKVKIKAVKA